MSWLCLFYAEISSPNGCSHFEANRRLLAVQNHPFCSGALRSRNRYLHKLILPSNIVTLELSSAIKYFGIDFSIFTLNPDKVTILFRLAVKPILAYFQQVKNLSGTWISEMKELSRQQQLSIDLKSGSIFLGTCKMMFRGSFLVVPLERI